MSLPSSVVPGHVVIPPVAGRLPTAELVSEVALLQRRLAGRAAIEQAKGILMERLGCTAREALRSGLMPSALFVPVGPCPAGIPERHRRTPRRRRVRTWGPGG
jgi:hypothetical protein